MFLLQMVCPYVQSRGGGVITGRPTPPGGQQHVPRTNGGREDPAKLTRAANLRTPLRCANSPRRRLRRQAKHQPLLSPADRTRRETSTASPPPPQPERQAPRASRINSHPTCHPSARGIPDKRSLLFTRLRLPGALVTGESQRR